MAEAVARAFGSMGGSTDAEAEPHHLLVEGGTGIGKSVAYLLPAVLFALRNNVRVVVSTNTINLQEQLIAKDIPDLLDVLRRRAGGGRLAIPVRATQGQGELPLPPALGSVCEHRHGLARRRPHGCQDARVAPRDPHRRPRRVAALRRGAGVVGPHERERVRDVHRRPGGRVLLPPRPRRGRVRAPARRQPLAAALQPPGGRLAAPRLRLPHRRRGAQPRGRGNAPVRVPRLAGDGREPRRAAWRRHPRLRNGRAGERAGGVAQGERRPPPRRGADAALQGARRVGAAHSGAGAVHGGAARARRGRDTHHPVGARAARVVGARHRVGRLRAQRSRGERARRRTPSRDGRTCRRRPRPSWSS